MIQVTKPLSFNRTIILAILFFRLVRPRNFLLSEDWLLVPLHVSFGFRHQTIDEYLVIFTNSTLNLMLERLKKWPDMTFIWAEVSFFKMWWDRLDSAKKMDVKSLINQGRLEIVNGGYVMPDEANTHYYALLHQYIYGG